MVIITDDYENVVIEGKGVDGCSVDEVNDPVNSKTPEASQTLNVVIEEKGVDEDPKVVKSSSKKKNKNKSARRKNQSEEPLKNNTDDSGGSSSQNSGDYPQFDLDDYPFAREEDRIMMKMANEYNRRNHAIITEQGFDGVSDRQLENLFEHIISIAQMLRNARKEGTQDDDNNNKKNNDNKNNNNKNNNNKIWCPRCHRLARTCSC